MATYFMIEGNTFPVFDALTLSDKNKTDLIDPYNAYSGSIAFVVNMPFQQFLILLLPVFILCCAPKVVLSENKSFVEL